MASAALGLMGSIYREEAERVFMQYGKMMGAVMLVLMVAAIPASADVILTITCTSDGQSSAREFLVPCNGGLADWTMSGPVDIFGQDNVLLGRIRELEFQSDSEPFVNLKFAVEAGTVDTTFDIHSAVLSFDPLMNPRAWASAGITLTGDGDGATLTGLLAGGNCYEARYNSSIVYTDLVTGFTASPDVTVTQSARRPNAGYEDLSVIINSMEAEFNFTLSALDQASGTSRFEVIPEPTSMSLLALGALSLLRRSRR